MIKRLSLPFIAGSWLLFVSLVVLTGWWLGNPVLVSAIPGHINLVFNAALCFVLCGVALILPNSKTRWSLSLRHGIGWLVLTMAALTVSQNLFHYSLGIDQWFASAAVDVFNPAPGRMGNTTAVLMIMMGIVLATWVPQPGKWRAYFMLATMLAMFLLGLAGLTGYWLGLEFLYHTSALMRMSTYTALNFCILAIGLWAVSHKNLALIPFYHERHDKKILLTSAVILFVVALVGELTGFSVFANENEKVLKQNLRDSLDMGVKTVTSTLHTVLKSVDDLADDKQFRDLLVRHSPTLTNDLKLLFMSRGYSAVEIHDASGATVFSMGDVRHGADAMTSLRLAVPDQAELFWGKGWTLRIVKPLLSGSDNQGTLQVNVPMVALDRLYGNFTGLGLTGKMLICAPGQAGGVLCASGRRDGLPQMKVLSAKQTSPSVQLALAGKHGDGMEVDIDNAEAFTVYDTVKDLGLGLVAKRDVAELYSTVRVQFEVVLPILLFSVGLGMLLLSWQVAPLIRKIIVSEKKALNSNARLRESESRFRSAFEFSAVGMALVSLEGRWLRINYSLSKILGYSEAEFLAMDYQRITYPDDIPVMASKLNDLLTGRLQGINMTKRIFTKNRDMLWILVNASLVYDAEHNPLYYIFQIQDIDQQKNAEDRLTMMAYHDALTGLDNRSAIERDVEAALVTAAANRQAFALLFLDLDHFKEVNDNYGHDMGDLLLKELAQRLQRIVRRSDKVGRIGGDEFVVLLEDIADESVVSDIAKKILQAVAQPIESNGMAFSITASLGISRYPANGTTMEALMKRADIALYCAKEFGKNNYQFFENSTIQE